MYEKSKYINRQQLKAGLGQLAYGLEERSLARCREWTFPD